MPSATCQVWQRVEANAGVLALAALAALAAAGCGDQERPTKLAEPVALRVTSVQGVSLPEVSFDLTVISHGGPADSRSMHFHVEHASTSDSSWDETLTLSQDPSIPAKFSSSRRLARIHRDSKGTLALLRADGTTLSPEDAANGLAAVASKVNSSRDDTLSANRLATAFGRLGMQAGGRRPIADGFVRTQADCDVEARNARNAAPVSQGSDGLEHHVRQTAAGLVDIGIDAGLGVVKTIAATSRDGVTRTLISNDYARGPGNRLVRRQVQIERMTNGVRRSTVLTLSKVQIDAQEVVP